MNHSDAKGMQVGLSKVVGLRCALARWMRAPDRAWRDRRRRPRHELEKSRHLRVRERVWAIFRAQRWRMAAVMLGIGLLALTETGVHFLERSELAEAEGEAVRLAAEIRARLETHTNRIIYLSSGLASYFEVNADTLDDQEINQLLNSLYRNSEHIRNLGVAVGYVLQYVVPQEGNEDVLGLDYRSVPEQFPAVQAVAQSMRPSLTPKLSLVQGGTGAIYRSPIVVDHKYWGMLSTVIDVDTLIADAVSQIPETDLEFAILDKGGPGSVLLGSPDLAAASGAKRLLTDSGWEVAVMPGLSAHQAVLAWIVRALGYFVSVMACLALYAIQTQREKLVHLSRHDAVTGLANRRAFNERLALSCRRVNRKPDHGFSIAIIDLDGFKEINDQYGHAIGDAVLIEVASRLQAALRSVDLVSRWGGDEFGLLIECADNRQVQEIERRIAAVFEEPIVFRHAQVNVGGSIGIVIAPQDGKSEHDLLTAADELMYRQKLGQSGRERRELASVRVTDPAVEAGPGNLPSC